MRESTRTSGSGLRRSIDSEGGRGQCDWLIEPSQKSSLTLRDQGGIQHQHPSIVGIKRNDGSRGRQMERSLMARRTVTRCLSRNVVSRLRREWTFFKIRWSHRVMIQIITTGRVYARYTRQHQPDDSNERQNRQSHSSYSTNERRFGDRFGLLQENPPQHTRLWIVAYWIAFWQQISQQNK